jgi:hypothetical protein
VKLSRLTRALAGGQLVRAWLVVRAKLHGGAAQLLAVALGLMAIVFLAVGGYVSLAGALPAWQAGALVAGMLMFVAVLLLIWGRWRASRAGRAPVGSPTSPPRPAPGSANPADDAYLTELGMQAGAEVARQVARQGVRPTDVALAAFLAGLAVSVGRTETRRGDDEDER